MRNRSLVFMQLLFLIPLIIGCAHAQIDTVHVRLVNVNKMTLNIEVIEVCFQEGSAPTSYPWDTSLIRVPPDTFQFKMAGTIHSDPPSFAFRFVKPNGRVSVYSDTILTSGYFKVFPPSHISIRTTDFIAALKE